MDEKFEMLVKEIKSYQNSKCYEETYGRGWHDATEFVAKQLTRYAEQLEKFETEKLVKFFCEK